MGSRRNYREGLLFCLGSVASFAIATGWAVAYVVVGPALGDDVWYDVCVCAGLVATPTLLLIIVFLPKVSHENAICFP